LRYRAGRRAEDIRAIDSWGESIEPQRAEGDENEKFEFLSSLDALIG
jgi:hypothetical protein